MYKRCVIGANYIYVHAHEVNCKLCRKKKCSITIHLWSHTQLGRSSCSCISVDSAVQDLFEQKLYESLKKRHGETKFLRRRGLLLETFEKKGARPSTSLSSPFLLLISASFHAIIYMKERRKQQRGGERWTHALCALLLLRRSEGLQHFLDLSLSTDDHGNAN
jgi:hypothetical protein